MKVQVYYKKGETFKTVFRGYVTVAYALEGCNISHVSLSDDGETKIAIGHPCKVELESQTEYPERKLWIKPRYRS